MIKVVVDSTADLPEDLCHEFEISVVPLNVQFGDETLRDGVDITKDEFYRRLIATTALPKTSAPMLGSFIETYERLAQSTDTIVSLHLSSKLSMTVAAARQAAETIPHIHIETIDTQQIATPMVYMAIAAAKAAREGKSLQEIVALVHDIGARAFLFVGLDTLKYLERGGRIGRVRAFLGTLLNVKPLIEVRHGETHPLEQVRTMKRLQDRLVELIRDRIPLAELSVLYTADRALAEKIADRLGESGVFPRSKIRLFQMGGVIGTHIGPGGIGVAGLRHST